MKTTAKVFLGRWFLAGMVLGLAVLAYGGDFDDDDFADRIHLTKLGGRKLAAITAVEIRALVERLGYL